MSVFSSKKFKLLQEKWKQKLEASGFKDTERSRHKGTIVQDLSERIHFRTSTVQCTTDYYDWATAVQHTPRYRFGKYRSRKRERHMWELHAEGEKDAEIGRIVGLSRWRVSDLLSGMRTYLEGKPEPLISPAISPTDVTQLEKENHELRWLLEKTRRELGRIARGRLVLVIACRSAAKQALRFIDDSRLLRGKPPRAC